MARPKSITDKQLLISARDSFLRNGHGISIQDIAKEIGISHAAIFQRYGSKRKLLIDSLKPQHEFEWTEEMLRGPQTEAEVHPQLTAICDLLNAYFAKHAPCMRVLQTAGVLPCEVFENGLPPSILALQFVADWIQKGIDRQIIQVCDPTSVSAMIVGALFAKSYLNNHVLEGENHRSMLGSTSHMIAFISNALLCHHHPKSN